MDVVPENFTPKSYHMRGSNIYGVKCQKLKALKITIFPIFFPRHPKSYQNRNFNP